ncbi:MAG: guanylate kinase [Pirellulales bacterium]|nr:guanylate kinase [Pirellulales bacterium]
MPSRPGQLVVLSGPSGAGKSTVLDALLANYPRHLRLAVSATTRPPRPGEVDGKDYYFLSPEEFQRRRQRGDFLECCEVFGRGHWYGTLHSEVGPSLAEGISVILEIDVDGARQVLRHYPDAMTIFLRPSTPAELERRLRSRGTETEEAIQRRLQVAKRELEYATTYRWQIINDHVDEAVEQINIIFNAQGIPS